MSNTETNRKMASVQVITKLEDIPNADNIVLASILGWKVVVKKGEFQVGDLCVFCEIDAILPDGPEWSEFMRPRKFRVKTAKLRGQLSQGLAFPINILYIVKDGEIIEGDTRVWQVGDDVSDVLDITKYEPIIPAQLLGLVRSTFPTQYLSKTDEIRVQSELGVLDEIKDKPFYITVKLDGTSATYIKIVQDDQKDFYVCSRNMAFKECDNVYWKIAQKYNLENVLLDNYAVQGEIVGPGIAKNRLGLKELDFFIFNVYNVKEQRYLNGMEAMLWCKAFGLKFVPIAFGTHDPKPEFFTLENLLERAKGTYDGTNNRREGIVIRPMEECYSRVLKGRLSFKVINNDFLLKDEE